MGRFLRQDESPPVANRQKRVTSERIALDYLDISSYRNATAQNPWKIFITDIETTTP